ncbi:50S ribosomal protein L9 [Patescibacteria group bacterium]|nr:MAG: 50S ribosomal protein L9 [Patescibacteria group bacterium]
MKVILLKDVVALGRKYEVKEVAAGHALNFLIPRKLAETATAGALKRLEVIRAQEEAKRKLNETLLLENIKNLNGTTIEITEAANDKGHLFAGIHKEELAARIKEQTRLDIPSEYIELEKPIKTVGDYALSVKINETIVPFELSVRAK